MFLRVDKLQVELPAPLRQDPNAAAALQELLAASYGEMQTVRAPLCVGRRALPPGSRHEEPAARWKEPNISRARDTLKAGSERLDGGVLA